MKDSAIVQRGRQFVENYPVEKYKEAIIRLFKDRGQEFIILDSEPPEPPFLVAGVAWAVGEKLLYSDCTEDVGRGNLLSSVLLKGQRRDIGQGIGIGAGYDQPYFIMVGFCFCIMMHVEPHHERSVV